MGSKYTVKILKILIKIVMTIEMMMIKIVIGAKKGERGSFEALPRRLPLLEAVTFGYPANSPHDKIPPWWEYVINR